MNVKRLTPIKLNPASAGFCSFARSYLFCQNLQVCSIAARSRLPSCKSSPLRYPGLQDLTDAQLSQADNGLIVDIISGSSSRLLSLTAESIADDATLDTGRGSTQQRKRNARLFAVKNTYNQLLDLARETLKENKDDIQECKLAERRPKLIDSGRADSGGVRHQRLA